MTVGAVISLAERAAALGRPLLANSNAQYAGPMPEVGALGWLMGSGSEPLCFGEVTAVGVGARGDMITVLDTEDGEPSWYTAPALSWVEHDGPEGVVA